MASTGRRREPRRTHLRDSADRFRSTWSSEFEPVLRKLQAGLQEAGTEVQRRKDALQTAGS